jgi:hypothetical protein
VPAPTVSILVPTHNRAHVWRSGWLLDTLHAIDRGDIELIIVDDHSTDDTLDLLTRELAARPLSYPATLARCCFDRIGANPASAGPDNVAFGLAQAPLLLHLDDDLRVDPGIVDYALSLSLTRSVLWLQLQFLDGDRRVIPGPLGADSRLRYARGHHSVAPLCPRRPLHWGGGFAVPTSEIRAIGGHAMELRGWRNSDTRLGERLVRHGCRSLLALDPRGIVAHLGPTWYRAHRSDRALIARSRYPAGDDPVIANGGPAFWSSAELAAATEILGTFAPDLILA